MVASSRHDAGGGFDNTSLYLQIKLFLGTSALCLATGLDLAVGSGHIPLPEDLCTSYHPVSDLLSSRHSAGRHRIFSRWGVFKRDG